MTQPEDYAGPMYVADDGNYGQGTSLCLAYSDLTPEQWEKVGELPDRDRLPFVLSCLYKT